MQISKKDWDNYINRLSKINTEAARLVKTYIDQNGVEDTQALINYSYRVAAKYGNASASLAAMMYDVVSDLEGMVLSSAELAELPKYGEVAKAVQGTLKTSQNPEEIAGAVSRLVKRTGQDTLLKNAERDKAQFAWIPNGDSCPFCITLASRGWQNMSSKALKGGHAEHIHSNCDCSYMIRHSKDFNVAGYNPEKYYQMYSEAEGKTGAEKINSMRRKYYEENKDKISAQKNDAYKKIKDKQHKGRGYDVLKEYLEDATPRRGLFDKEANFENKMGEEETAKIIFNKLGGDIVLREEVNGQKNPDYLWMDRLWDLKTISSEKAANSAIKSGMQQIRSNPGGIILNMGEHNLSMDSLRKYIDLRMTWYPKECADIMIISKGEIVKILRY